jgi:hypothetical protein
MTSLSISYDHRIVDGTEAAHFPTAVKIILETGFTADTLDMLRIPPLEGPNDARCWHLPRHDSPWSEEMNTFPRSSDSRLLRSIGEFWPWRTERSSVT